MKKRICFLLVCTMFQSMAVTASASEYKYPNAIWKPHDGYVAAMESSDHKNVIKYGNEVMNILKSQPENSQVISNFGSRTLGVAEAHESLGEYPQSAEMFKNYVKYAKLLGHEDGVKVSEAKIKQYESEVRVFTDTGTPTYFGAVNEPKNGVLFGVPYGSPTRTSLPNESMILLYHTLGNSDLGWAEMVFEQAAQQGVAIEFALNCDAEGNDIRGIDGFVGNMKELSALFARYPQVPVYLRFAAEFDVWTNAIDAPTFISAFQKASNIFKANSHVAMVWSPNFISGWDVDVHSYYPGDTYVDWIGISTYMNHYFQGKKEYADNYTEVVWRSGVNANPVILIEDFVKTYGDRKPIMLSETGATHTVKTLNENVTPWGLQKLKELYLNVPMVYPQVKLIAHFDQFIEGEANDFSLKNSPTLKQGYLDLTKNKRMIQDSGVGVAPLTYSELSDTMVVNTTLPISTYAHIYGGDTQKVEYFIDDALKASSTVMPFSQVLDFTTLPIGNHTLKIVATNANGVSGEKSMTIIKN